MRGVQIGINRSFSARRYSQLDSALIPEKSATSKPRNSSEAGFLCIVLAFSIENGEPIHPRTWNHEFIDLREVKDQWQPVHSS